MHNSSKIPVSPVNSQVYSNAYIGHWKLAQAVGSGAVADSSGNGRNLALGSSLVDANFWGDEHGFATFPGDLSGGGLGQNFSVVNNDAYPLFDWTDTGMLVMGWFRQAASDVTSGSVDVMGHGGSGNQEGWRLVLSSTGGLSFRIHDGSSLSQSGNQGDFDDGVLHHFAVAYDGTTELVSIYIDGVVGGTVNAESMPGTAAGMNTAQTLSPEPNQFAIGAHTNAVSVNTTPGEIRDVHLLHFAGGIPSTVLRIIRYSRANLYAPVPAWVIQG